jgi:hypothetical protein
LDGFAVCLPAGRGDPACWSSRTNRPGTGTGAAIIGEPNLLKGVIVPPLVKIYVEFPPW